MNDLAFLETTLGNHFGVNALNLKAMPVSGGDIHQSLVINLRVASDGDIHHIPENVFVKLNSGAGKDVLKTEYESLQSINTLIPDLYPKALMFDDSGSKAYLVMDYHHLESLNGDNAAQAGLALAQQHKVTNEQFGWDSDNYIGLTPQSNRWASNWCSFFKEQRLLPILQRAQHRGLSKHNVQRVHNLIDVLEQILSHQVLPSLVHGDLWSGNASFDSQRQTPLFYDPAPYYGDREVDIAMTELFGRQPNDFYQSYQAEWPLEEGYEQRKAVYNLYHALNHVVLFGLSYNGLVEHCLDQIGG